MSLFSDTTTPFLNVFIYRTVTIVTRFVYLFIYYFYLLLLFIYYRSNGYQEILTHSSQLFNREENGIKRLLIQVWNRYTFQIKSVFSFCLFLNNSHCKMICRLNHIYKL